MRDIGISRQSSSDSIVKRGLQGDNEYRSSFDSYILDVRDAHDYGEKELPVEEYLKVLRSDDYFILRYPSTRKSEQVLIPSRKFPPLEKSEVLTMVQEDDRVKLAAKQIRAVSALVYRKPKMLNKVIDKVTHDPSSSTEFSQCILKTPTSFCSLLGFNFFGIKSKTRVSAEENIVFLSNAITVYGRVVRSVERQILEDYRQMQKDKGGEVKIPLSVQNLLALPINLQREKLSSSAVVRQEVSQFSKKISSCLSPSDMKAINSGNSRALARSLGISTKTAKDITEIVQKVMEACDYSKTVELRKREHRKFRVYSQRAMAMSG